MKSILKRLLAIMTVGVIAFSMMSVDTYASDDDVFAEDSSGNVFGAGNVVDIATKAMGDLPNELFEAGYEVRANNKNIGGSAFLAGNIVSATGSNIDGSLYMAGRNLYIDSKVKNNIWAAGQNISLGTNTSVRGVHLAAATVEISGEYVAADIVADTVIINANVSGNVYIAAEHVTIGENASIDGEITVKSVNEPKVSGSAKVDNLVFEQVKKASDDDVSLSNQENASSKASFVSRIKRVVVNILKFAIIGIIFTALFGKSLTSSYECAMKRPAAVWGIGLLTLIAVPIVSIILCITIIGLPVAGLLVVAYILALLFSRVFFFASFVRELIFTHTGKRLNPYLETIVAVAVGAVVKEIPIISAITGFIGVLYTLGYIVLAMSGSVSSNKNKVKADAISAEDTNE